MAGGALLVYLIPSSLTRVGISIPMVGQAAAFQAMPMYGSLASGGYYGLRLNFIPLIVSFSAHLSFFVCIGCPAAFIESLTVAEHRRLSPHSSGLAGFRESPTG